MTNEMDIDRIAEQYAKLRPLLDNLSLEMLDLSEPADFKEAARTLGIRAARHDPDHPNEWETVVLTEYVLYGLFRRGGNLVDRCLELGSDLFSETQIGLLRAMREARYAYLTIAEAFPGVGVAAEDDQTGERVFLADLLLSKSAKKGMRVAGRIVPFPGFFVLSGPSLLAVPQAVEPLADFLRREPKPQNRMEAAAQDAKATRLLLQSGALDHASYRFHDEAAPPRRQDVSTAGTLKADPDAARPKTGRNAPCPCGSGRKYKKCCLPKAGGAKAYSVSEIAAAVKNILPSPSLQDVQSWPTERVVEELKAVGVPFKHEQFLRDVALFDSAFALSSHWLDVFSPQASVRNEDLTYYAAWTLWGRLASHVPCIELIDDRIEEGWDLLEMQNLPAEACEAWLAAWEMLRSRFTGRSDDPNALTKLLQMEFSIDEFVGELLHTISHLCIDGFDYRLRCVALCEEYVEAFPGTAPEKLSALKRIIAMSPFYDGEFERGDENFGRFVEENPTAPETYLTWAKISAAAAGKREPSDFSKPIRILQTALENKVDDPDGQVRALLEDLQKRQETE